MCRRADLGRGTSRRLSPPQCLNPVRDNRAIVREASAAARGARWQLRALFPVPLATVLPLLVCEFPRRNRVLPRAPKSRRGPAPRASRRSGRLAGIGDIGLLLPEFLGLGRPWPTLSRGPCRRHRSLRRSKQADVSAYLPEARRPLKRDLVQAPMAGSAAPFAKSEAEFECRCWMPTAR